MIACQEKKTQKTVKLTERRAGVFSLKYEDLKNLGEIFQVEDSLFFFFSEHVSLRTIANRINWL